MLGPSHIGARPQDDGPGAATASAIGRLEEIHLVKFHRIRRVASISSAALLSLMLLGIGTTSATPPPANWGSTGPSATASAASPALGVVGGSVWFESTWQNASSSTLSSVYLKGSGDGSITQYGTPPQYAIFATVNGKASTACSKADPLTCTFKNVKPQAILQVAVVYTVPASDLSQDCPVGKSVGFNTVPTGSTLFDTVTQPAMCEKFEWSSTGAPGSDPGASHGDTWNWFDGVKISADAVNYNGQFALDISSVANAQAVDSTNKQATTAFLRGASMIPVTVLDGDAAAGTSCNSLIIDCSTDLWPAADWSIVSVNNGDPVTGLTLYEFQLRLDSSEIPNNVNQNNLKIYHFWDGGEEVISATCDPTTGTPTNVPPACRVVTKLAGGDLLVTIWSLHNGGLHGTF
jgi:hypothetical protein